MRPSAANSSTVPSARYPTLVDTVIEAGLSVNADDTTLRAPKESNANAQIACRARVPTPRPWNPRPIHEPVSPVRLLGKSVAANAWQPTISPSTTMAVSNFQSVMVIAPRTDQWYWMNLRDTSSGVPTVQGTRNGICSAG